MSSTEIYPPPDSQVTKDTNNDRALDTPSSQPDTSAQRSVQAWDDMNKLLKSGAFEAKSTSSQNPEIARMLGKGFGIDFTPPAGSEKSAPKEQGAMSATVDPVQDKKPEDKDAGKSSSDNSQGDKEQSTAGRSARPDGQKQAENDDRETELQDGKKKDQKQEEKKTEKKSFFTEPYDATKADQLIKDLGDDSFKTRESAQAKLERMGPQALEKLQEASKDKDPEVSKRADRAINTIKTHEQQEARDKALAQAKSLGPAAEAMLRSLNIDYSKEIQPVAAEEGAVGLMGPSFTIGQPRGVPTAEQQKQIDKTLSDLDNAGAGSKSISALEKAEKEKAANEYATDAITAETKGNFTNMRLLDSASKYARLNYAEALSKSEKAADKTKAVDVLTDHVNKQESFKPTDEFRQLAASTGADKSEQFIKAIERRCGKDVANSFRSHD